MGFFPALLLALVSGGLSFLTPCVFPLVPLYLAYFSGKSDKLSKNNQSKLIMNVFAFVVGFTVVFLLLGLSSGIFFILLQNYQIVKYIFATLLIILGLSKFGLIKISFFMRDSRKLNLPKNVNLFSALIFGMFFALGWSPCIGPLLGNALFMAGSQASRSSRFFVLLFFSLGLAVPFMLAAIFVDKFNDFFHKNRKHYLLIERLVGIFLILTSVWFIFS